MYLREQIRKGEKAAGVFEGAEPPVLTWPQQDLNLRPTDYESAALTAELWGLKGED